MAIAQPPVAVISSNVCRSDPSYLGSGSMVRAVSPTTAPSAASRCAIAFPSPRLAPVTRATLPAQAPVTFDPPPTAPSRPRERLLPGREFRYPLARSIGTTVGPTGAATCSSSAGRQNHASAAELSLSYRPDCLRDLLNLCLTKSQLKR